jgi:hypothetical protein
MATAIAVVYLVGWISAAGVARSRAGLGQRGRLTPGLILGSLPWFLMQMATMIAWPAFLVVWLARGRPESPWKSITTADGSIRVRRKTVMENQ